MKNKKGFTLVEVIVSVSLIMIVVLYLLRTIVTISDRNNELVTQQDYAVYENNLLDKFYKDAESIDSNNKLKGIDNSDNKVIKYLDIINNDAPVELVIDPTNERIIYNKIIYKLPDNVTISPKCYVDSDLVDCTNQNESDKFYYSITTVARERDENDKYGIIISNIYIKVYDKDEIIKLMYQGNLETYKVKFYANLNPNDTDETESVYDTVNVLKGNYLTSDMLPLPPSNNIYYFDNWHTNRTTSSLVNYPYKVDSDISLYAHWKDSDFKIIFDKNSANAPAGKIQGTMTDIGMIIGETKMLPSNGYTSQGYEIDVNQEWSTSTTSKVCGTNNKWGNCSTVFGPVSQSDYNNLPTDPDDGKKYIRLYAQWNPNTYRIRYRGNGGTLKNGNTIFTDSKVFEYGKVYNYDPPTDYVVMENDAIYGNNLPFTRVGYDFNGWKTQTGYNGWPAGYPKDKSPQSTRWVWPNGTYDIGAIKENYLDLYAQWKPHTLTVTYQYTNSPNSTSNGTYNGYTNAGCYPTSSAESYKVVKWSNTATYGQPYTVYKNWWVCPRYKFVGWNERRDGKGTNWTPESTWSKWGKWGTDDYDHDVTLYSIWTLSPTYTVTYDKNKPSTASSNVGGSTPNSSHVVDVSSPLSTNGYTLTGWKFTGWNTEEDGTGTSYSNGQSVKNLSTTDGAEVTLYAQWTPETYTIVFHGNGGKYNGNSTYSKGANYYSYDTTYTGQNKIVLDNTYFKKTGYRFVRWETQAGYLGWSAGYPGSDSWKWNVYNGKTTASGLSMGIGDETAYKLDLYAQWDPNSYNLYVVPNGDSTNKAYFEGSSGTSTLPVTYDTASSSNIGKATRYCYTLNGYYTAASGGTKVFDANGKAITGTYWTPASSDPNYIMWHYEGNLTVYAQWTKNSSCSSSTPPSQPSTNCLKFSKNDCPGGWSYRHYGCDEYCSMACTPVGNCKTLYQNLKKFSNLSISDTTGSSCGSTTSSNALDPAWPSSGYRYKVYCSMQFKK